MQAEFYDAVASLTTGRVLPMPLSRNLAGVCPGLHELRLRDHAGQARVFYYIKKLDAIYLLHAFAKKTQQLPKREIQVALKRVGRI